MLGKLDTAAVRACVVWVPLSRGMVPNATREVSDPRARHYWDGEGQLIASYREVLDGYEEPVWDTYVSLKRCEVDGDRPPTPDYWMHQLGSATRPRAKGPFWDARLFLDRTRKLARVSKLQTIP